MKKRLCLIAVIICLVACTGAYACYTQYTVARGLISNTIYHSFRDSKGYLWFSSDKGVSKFDGKTFKHYSTLQGLTDNNVFNLYEDRMGRIWLFTFNGVPCYIRNDSVFTANNDPFLRHIPAVSFPVCMLAEDDTTVYLGYSTGQILEVKGSKVKMVIGPREKDQVYAIYKSGNLVSARGAFSRLTIKDGGIAGYEKKSFEQTFKYGDKLIIAHADTVELYREERLAYSTKIDGLRLETIISFYCDDAGYIFICTAKGLIIVNYKNGNKTRLFANSIVTSVDGDLYGNYWVSTAGNGIYCLNREFADMRFIINTNKLVYTHEGQVFSISDSNLYEFHENAIRDIKLPFLNMYEPLFLNDDLFMFSYGARTFIYNRYLKHYDTVNRFVKCVYNYNPGHFLLVAPDFICVARLTESSCRFLDTIYPPSRILASAYAKKSKKVYLLSLNSLYGYDPQKNEYSKIDTILCQPLNLFCVDDKIVVVTNNQTAIVYDVNNKCPKIEISTGNIFIHELYSLNHNNYLIRSNEGYYLWRLNSGARPFLKKIDHLFRSTEVCMYPYGDGILCNVDNMLYTFPTKLLYERAGSPVLFIKKLVLNHKEYDAARPVTGKYGSNNNVNIKVGSLYFNNSDNYFQYSVVRSGSTGEWINSDGSDINIWLPDFGSYTILLRVVTENGIASPVKTISIKLLAPFYYTWWFLGFVIVAAFAAVLATVFFIFKKRRQRMRNELHFLQLEHKAINSLLNPHFIFNAINNIQHLVNENEREQANGYLAMLSKLIRQNIENLKFDFIPLEKELLLVKNYVMLQNLRFNEGIHLQITNAVSAPDILIPPLLIHTFVENAIVHGYRENITDFTIRVDLSISTDDYLIINVTDNGVGYKENNSISQDSKTSMGIAFTQERLKRLSDFYKVVHSVQVSSRAGARGTEVILILYAKFRALVTPVQS